MTSLYDILKANRLGMESDPWLCILGEAWRASEEDYKEYTGLVPYTFIGNGQPLISWIIKGNTVQSGTPTPDSPVMPQGTGERTNNLCDESAIQQGYYGALGNYSVFTADAKYRCFKLDLPAGIYTLNISADEDMYILRCSNSVDGAIAVYSAPPYTFTLSTDATIYVSWRNTDTTNSFTNMKVMLNTGSSPLPHEPYGYKIPISSANTTMPVYLGEVETTRRIAKIDLGTMNWGKTASGNFWATTAIPNIRTINNSSTGNAICDMFKEATPNNVANEPYSFSSCLNTVGRPFINKTGFEDLTAEEFKQAMAGVYMWYVLAEPETGIINEPLMKIGDYVDTVSMEQAGVQIPTARGTNTLDVLTDVKPSEVYIKYKSR